MNKRIDLLPAFWHGDKPVTPEIIEEFWKLIESQSDLIDKYKCPHCKKKLQKESEHIFYCPCTPELKLSIG